MTDRVRRRYPAGFLLLAVWLAPVIPTEATASPGDTLFTQIDPVLVHEAPADDAPVAARLQRGEKLKEFRRQGSWVKVLVYSRIGRDGWVRSSEVGPRDPTAGDGGAPTPRAEQPPVSPEEPGPQAALPSGHRYIILVEGLPFTGFEAVCEIVTNSGDRIRRKLSGASPKSYSVDARAISCKVDKDGKPGRLFVALQKDGRTVACHSTTGSFGRIKVRSAGPWGKARGLECNPRNLCVARRLPCALG